MCLWTSPHRCREGATRGLDLSLRVLSEAHVGAVQVSSIFSEDANVSITGTTQVYNGLVSGRLKRRENGDHLLVFMAAQ